MESIEGLRCELSFGHYEDSDDGEYSWLTSDFRYPIEISGTSDFNALLDSHRLELFNQINLAFKRFEKEYAIMSGGKEA
jgi:hypothetical protein